MTHSPGNHIWQVAPQFNTLMSASSLMTDEDVTEDSPLKSYGQVVLILCGLIASGKSTFAEHLQHFFPHFRRCNQDDLGERRHVEQLARESLGRGLSVCIDRTNFNLAQRSHWIRIAQEYPEIPIWVIVFDTPYEVCAARLEKRRGDHPTIKSPEQGLSVLARFANDFQYPTPLEGYNRVLYIHPSDHPSPVYSRSEVADILKRVRDSPAVTSEICSGPSTSFRGNLNRGSDSGWRRGFVPSRNFNYGSFRGGHNVSVFRGVNKILKTPSALGRVEDQDRASAIDNEGTGTAQDPILID